jgi:hypothetical protein
MGVDLPNRLANGAGNLPDALKYMENFDMLLATALGNFLSNGGLEKWNLATTFTNPANTDPLADSWTNIKSGTSSPTVNVTRESTTIDTDTYSLKGNITVAGSSNSLWGIKQTLTAYSRFGGETVIFTASVRCSTASKARLKITDGVTTQYSSYHTGGGTFEKLYVAFTVNSTPSELSVFLEVTSDFTGAVYFDSAFINVISSLMSTTAKAALTFKKFYSAYLQLIGGTMEGAIAMGGNKITGAGAASANGDLTRYEQVLLLAGGTMTGDLIPKNNSGTPTANGLYKQSIVKAWVQWTISGTTPTIQDSYNVSAVTYNSATGDYTVSFSRAMANALYAAVGMAQYDGIVGYYNTANTLAGSMKVQLSDAAGNPKNTALNSLIVIGQQ